jgi:uncharacterized membrane protein
MNKMRRNSLLLLSACYGVLWVGGVLQHVLHRDQRTEQGWLATLFLVLAAILVFVGTRNRYEITTLLGVALLGFISEVMGVHLHVPFGEYNYSNILRPKLFDVPLVMALAWVTLVAYVKQMLSYVNLSSWVERIVGAMWLTSIDLVIDPLAANQLGYWHWANRGVYYGVPMTNFAGWFVVSLLAFTICRKKFEPSVSVRLTGVTIILFFTILSVAHGSDLVTLFGCGLLLVHLLTRLLILRRKKISPNLA